MGGKKISRKKRILLLLCSFIILILYIFLIFFIWMMAKTPDEFMIKRKTRFEYQKGLECAGYSSAYVMRNFGEEASGTVLYREIKNKNPDGTVYSEELVKLLRAHGYRAYIKTGCLLSLKYDLSKNGKAVIALCAEKPGSEYLHFLPVVGYDENNIYAADSLMYLTKENENTVYNRIIKSSDFKKMWNTGYAINNVYIVVTK